MTTRPEGSVLTRWRAGVVQIALTHRSDDWDAFFEARSHFRTVLNTNVYAPQPCINFHQLQAIKILDLLDKHYPIEVTNDNP